MARVRVRSWMFSRLSGLLVGVALVAAVSGVVRLLDAFVPVRSLLVLYLLAVLPVALGWGPGLAVVVTLLSVTAFVGLFLAPVHLGITQPQTLLPLGVFLIAAVVIGEVSARARRRARESARLMEEQSALGRVATLVAKAMSPSEVFDAVIREVALLCRADLARLERFEADGTVTGVAAWSRVPVRLAVGTRFSLEGVSIAGQVRETGAPVRVDSFVDATGPIAKEAQELGIRCSVGCPIVVAGRLWGVIAASSRAEHSFPPNTEAQIGKFSELVATAVANAQSRAEITELLEDQAALRRIATLVARGSPTQTVVSAVAEEVGRLFGAIGTIIVRLDPDGLATVVARTGTHEAQIAEGSRWKIERPAVTAEVLETGRPARRDGYGGVPGPFGAATDRTGIRASVGIPIVVGGRPWGALTVGSGEERVQAGAEERLSGFAELVAITVAAAEGAAELAASRARVVAAADEARRRIERDLHDGAQQRLVAFGLELRLLQESVPPELPEVRAGIGGVADGLGDVLDALREMSRGIHPAVLSEGGLGPALRALTRRSAIPVELDVRTRARYPEPVEVAVYYAASEALTNTAKYADASYVTVLVEEQYGVMLVLTVQDDGVGGADPEKGSGLVGLRDRVEALGGAFAVRSPAGEGTQIWVALPLVPV